MRRFTMEVRRSHRALAGFLPVVVLCIISFSLSPLPLPAQESLLQKAFKGAVAEESVLQKAQKVKEIVVGTSGDYRPFSYLNPQTNQYEGMDIELAQKLGAALGAKVTFVRFKWPEVTQDLIDGKFDIAMGGIGRNVARGLVVAYTNSYMTFGTCPLVRKGTEAKYTDFAAIDQPSVKVILNQGGINDRYFTPLLKRAVILRHNKNEEIALKVKDGTADVWITDNVEALFWAKTLPGLVAVNPSKTFTVGTKGYMIRQGDQIFLNWLNLWLDQMFLQGDIAALEKKWLGMALGTK
jgi:cyclohexadienyl dehydratase